MRKHLLALALAAMVILSYESNVPNIVNYKTAIENEYADWEQQLMQRENAVREAERSLGISP